VSTAPTWNPISGTDPVLYTGTVTVDDGSNFKENFPVRIHDAGSVKICGFILSVSGNDIEIITENNATVSTGDTVDCGYLFVLKNLDGSQILKSPEVNINYFRGDITRENWTSLTPSSFEVDFSTGQIALPAFNFDGAEVAYAAQTFQEAKDAGDFTGVNTTFDSENTSPVVVQLADVFMFDGTNYLQQCISNVQINIANEVYKKLCIASKGVQETLRTSRKVTGSLNTFYESKDFQDAFKNDTDYNFRALFNYATDLNAATGNKVFTTTPGNIVAVSIPQLKFSEVSVEEDSGIFKYANQFSAEPIEGDDEIYFAIL